MIRTSKIHGQLQQLVLSSWFVWETMGVESGFTSRCYSVLPFNYKSYISQSLCITSGTIEELLYKRQYIVYRINPKKDAIGLGGMYKAKHLHCFINNWNFYLIPCWFNVKQLNRMSQLCPGGCVATVMFFRPNVRYQQQLPCHFV